MISNYTGRKTESYAVTLPGLTIYFSYSTPVAFTDGQSTVVRKNDWGTTTGRHMNAIDGGDYASRVPGDEFNRLLDVAFARAVKDIAKEV